MRTKLLPIVLIALVLAGCGGAEEAPPPTNTPEPIPPTEAPEATQAPEPTNTPLPSPTKTPLPEGVLFRDDFNGELDPSWRWENENPDKWTFTDDGWLEIIGEPDSLLGDNRQNNLLWNKLPVGDFQITVHLKANPYANFHQATIYIYENPTNYIALNRGYCDICDTGGGGFYMEYKIDQAWGAYQKATDAEDVYLRLESKDKILSGYYATEEGQWERIGRFGDYFEFSNVGIGVTNVGTEDAVIGVFDYFEISLP